MRISSCEGRQVLTLSLRAGKESPTVAKTVSGCTCVFVCVPVHEHSYFCVFLDSTLFESLEFFKSVNPTFLFLEIISRNPYEETLI